MSDGQPGAAAVRMRRSRERRRKGRRCVSVEISTAKIEAMIKAGALDPVARNAPDAIGVALGKMLDRLPVQIWRAPLGGGNIVILDLTDGFVDYLATLGWLPRGERHASSTLKDALVGFASRGLRMSELNPHLFRP